MDIRNRIVEYRVIEPDELAPNPRNWRGHPEAQRDALRGVLAEIGIAGALLAYYSPRNGGKLTLVDGHERATVDTPWPCLILDVTDAEADLLLATYDPLGALALSDAAAYDQLIRGIDTVSPALQTLIADTAERAGVLSDLTKTPAAGLPFGDFDDQDDTAPDRYVSFAFGDYRGRVGRIVYDSFVAAYQAEQRESGEPMLDDVLRSWLTLEPT